MTKLLACLAAGLLMSTSALAQQELAIRRDGTKPYTAEFATVVGAAPGLGLGAEVFIMPKVAAFVTAAYLDADVAGNVIEEIQEDNEGPLPDETIGTSTVAGFRWYAAPQTHSPYLAAGVGYGDNKTTWDYEGETVTSRYIAVLPTAQLGYRWIFNNNVLFRIGVGGQTNDVQSSSVTTENDNDLAREGADKVDDLQSQYFLAQLDLGLGYAF